jgi:hypothetical protein
MVGLRLIQLPVHFFANYLELEMQSSEMQSQPSIQFFILQCQSEAFRVRPNITRVPYQEKLATKDRG